MNWPGFSAVSLAWLLTLAVPIIIMYFLKLKRPRVEVPSLALWRQVLSDQRVNSPFQKFKRSLLLVLQLLLLFALVLAAMQPYWPTGSGQAQFIPVLIDISASMGAVDQPGGETRLERAKTEVRKLIDGLLPSQQLALIAVDHSAKRLTEFTNNQRVLRDALEQLRVRPVPSRLEDGLRMAQALTRTVPVQSVVLISDGNIPDIIDFELPFRLNYQRLATSGGNVGITDFNARRGERGWEVFARLEASSPSISADDDASGADRLVEATLLQDGSPQRSETIAVSPGKAARVSFSLETDAATSLTLRLNPDGFDALAADNEAFLELPAQRPVSVFVASELGTYRHALESLPGVSLWPQDGEPTPARVDLMITDQAAASQPLALVKLSVGVVPAELESLVEVQSGVVDVVDWNRTAALLRHVQLLDVQIADEPVSKPGIGERDFELAGFQVLAMGKRGPLIVERATSGQAQAALLFHTDRSSLPYRVGFPILVANAVEMARERASLSDSRSLPTGPLPPVSAVAGATYQWTGPGTAEQLASTADGQLIGLAADEPGRYLLESAGHPTRAIGVSLLAPTETGLASVERLSFPETSVTTATERLKVDAPLWTWFALLGMVALLAEWWYFQKRPGGVPA